jgi:predicted acylesterase/phospholipase RssA
MTSNTQKPTLGLALSGSGNRSSFYIGFLEVLEEENINIDFISACSGATLVASAYACGVLPKFKDYILKMNRKDFFSIITRDQGQNGLYKLDYLEKLLNENFTKNKTFEELKVKMIFTAVDINSGELVDLYMGDIAHAARISCTTPALFEPVQWGSRVLVDGGLLSVIPIESLKKFQPTVSLSINLAKTRNIFTGAQMNVKKIINQVQKFLPVSNIAQFIKTPFINSADTNLTKPTNFFSVWGKSLDLAIYANQKYLNNQGCDITIEPKFENKSRASLSAKNMKSNYEYGRIIAKEYLPVIKKHLAQKTILN